MLPMSAWNIDSSSTEYIEPSFRKAKSNNTHTCDLLKKTAMDAYFPCDFLQLFHIETTTKYVEEPPPSFAKELHFLLWTRALD